MIKQAAPEPEPLPPPVEGRAPSAAELEAKASNGRYYLNDVWKIVREFPSADNYECGVDLMQLAATIGPAVHAGGFLTVDSSARLNSLHHALHLAEAWASLVREARTSKVLHIVRRTPENCGAMLMMQRQEHIRGHVEEMTPISMIAICREEQLLLTRDRVPEHDVLCRTLVNMATGRDDPVVREGAADAALKEAVPEPEAVAGEKADPEGGESPNMPDALFKQQMHALRVMMDAMGVPPPPTGPLGPEEGEEDEARAALAAMSV